MPSDNASRPPSPNGNDGANANDEERSLSPLPSDSGILRTTNVDICETILQTILGNETHLHPNSLGSVASFLWKNDGNGPFDGRFGKWASDGRLKRNMNDRVRSILNHYSNWNEGEIEYPTQVQILAKRIVREREDSCAEANQRRATEQRQVQARQETNNLREGTLGALPQQRGVGVPRRFDQIDRDRARDAASLLGQNPRSQNNRTQPVLPLPVAPVAPVAPAAAVNGRGNGRNQAPVGRGDNSGRAGAIAANRQAQRNARGQAQRDLAREASGQGRGVIRVQDAEDTELMRRPRNTDFVNLFDRVDGVLGENMRRLTDAISSRNNVHRPAVPAVPPTPPHTVAAPTPQPLLGAQITELYKRRKIAQEAGDMENSVRNYSRIIGQLERREQAELQLAFGITDAAGNTSDDSTE